MCVFCVVLDVSLFCVLCRFGCIFIVCFVFCVLCVVGRLLALLIGTFMAGNPFSHNTDLVSSITLGIAFRYILQSLKRQPDHKMFLFGLTALNEFKTRLSEWSQVHSFYLLSTEAMSCENFVCRLMTHASFVC